MYAVIDTSVLIASTQEFHIHHEASAKLLKKVHDKRVKGCLSAHSLTEYYSSLTPLPLKYRLSPNTTLTLINENLLKAFEVVDLNCEDYLKALKRTAERDLTSGAIYDALIYQAAVKKDAKKLYTWNKKHFDRLADPGIQILHP